MRDKITTIIVGSYHSKLVLDFHEDHKANLLHKDSVW